MLDIKGIISPILTPMNEDESINEKELRNQVNRMIDAGIHGIFPFGTNGESYILTIDEKKQILEIVIDEVDNRVPIYAGTGCVSTKETIELSLFAQNSGVQALSLITPYFAKASQEELFIHFQSVAQSVEIPIVLYNIPARTGNQIDVNTVRRLSEVANIKGVKDSSGDFNTILQYINATKDKDFAVLSGNDALILWTLLAGGKGAVSGCSNVYPKTMVNIYESFISGNLEMAKSYQDKIQTLRECFKYGNPNTVTKTAVRLLGYPVGECRKPFNSLPEEGVIRLQKVLEANIELGID